MGYTAGFIEREHFYDDATAGPHATLEHWTTEIEYQALWVHHLERLFALI